MPRAVAIIGLLPVIAASNTGLNQVTGARFWSHTASTRVIIDLSGPFEFRSDRAMNPDRLFFDISGARPWIDGKRIAVRPVGDRLLKRLRIAETAPGTTRIVFDLEAPVEFTATKLDTPDRLVVELRPAGTYVSSTALPQGRTVVAEHSFGRVFVQPREPALHYPVILPAAELPPMQTSITRPSGFYLPDPLRYQVVTPPVRTARNVQFASSGPAYVPKAYPTRPTPTTVVLPSQKPLVESARTPSRGSSPRGSISSSASLTRALGLKINRVVIDAGHGGHDQGTIGSNGTLEKDVVLDVALRVAKLIQERLGAEVVLTRSDDTFIPLQERTAIANQHKADLFLSIHANSSPAAQVAGTETYFLNFTNSAGALDVAARENAGADKSVGELRDLIQSITLNDKVQESRLLAEEVERAISVNASKNNPAAKDRGIKRAPFVVLIGASMPSILAEIGFLSNPRDENNLSKTEYRQKVAEALFKGVSQYSQSLSHFDVAEKTDKAEKRLAGLN